MDAFDNCRVKNKHGPRMTSSDAASTLPTSLLLSLRVGCCGLGTGCSPPVRHLSMSGSGRVGKELWRPGPHR
jgi:hypothetical protein